MKLKVTFEIQTIDQAVELLADLRKNLKVLNANIVVGK